MKKVIAAAAVLASLALAQGAFAAPNSASISVAYVPPKLATSAQTKIHVNVAATSDAIAAVNIYSGTDTATLTAAAGTQIGTVEATAIAHDQGGLTLPLSGNIVADDPSKHTTDVCSPGANAAVWNMSLSVAGQTLVIPIYVNRTSGAEAALGATKLTICLPPWDIPVGTPGRAQFGAQLTDALLTVNNVFTSGVAAGQTVWEALFTPYKPGVGRPDPNLTWEARAVVPVPVVLSIKATYVKKSNTWKLSGKLTEGGKPVPRWTIHLARGLTSSNLSTRSATKTTLLGAWASAGHLKPNKTTYFQASASAPERDYSQTGCESPHANIAPAGCTSATLPAYNVKSVVVRVKR
jgi:hypothetical protein